MILHVRLHRALKMEKIVNSKYVTLHSKYIIIFYPEDFHEWKTSEKNSTIQIIKIECIFFQMRRKINQDMTPTFPENLEEEEKDFIFWEQTQNWTLLERILEHYGLSHLGKFSKKNWNRREGGRAENWDRYIVLIRRGLHKSESHMWQS